MEPGEYKTMYTVEDRHWWYLGMQRITTGLLDHLYPGRTDLNILDAGCGTGAVMVYLSRYGAVAGFDLSELALDFCRQRGLTRLCRATVSRLPYPDQAYDLVTSFDVLYHVQVSDYRRAIGEFHRVLKPGGRLFLRLPAYNWLRAHHDEVVHTRHRFTDAEIGHALTAGGFAVEKLSYANTLLFPLALVKRLGERLAPARSGSSDVQANPGWLDRWLGRLLGLEARWLVRHRLPYGLTVVAVARKPDSAAP
jgi:SAM-dependent methyltransferase